MTLPHSAGMTSAATPNVMKAVPNTRMGATLNAPPVITPVP